MLKEEFKMQKSEKLLSLLLAVMILCGTAPLAALSEIELFSMKAEAIECSGTCGDNLT